MKSLHKDILPALSLILSLLFCGCESASVGSSANSFDQTRGRIVRLQASFSGLPTGVDEVRFGGYEAGGGQIYGPVALPRSESLDFPNVPPSATTFVVEYLVEDQLVGISSGTLRTTNSETLVLTEPEVLSPAEALRGTDIARAQGSVDSTESVVVSPEQVSLEKNTVALLTVKGYLPQGQVLDLSSSVTWTTSRRAVATVRHGLVRGVDNGSATVTAYLDGLAIETPITVTDALSNPPDLIIQDGRAHTFDLEQGTYDGRAFEGWNAANKTVMVGLFQVGKGATLNFVGDEPFVLSAQGEINIAGQINRDGEAILTFPPTPSSFQSSGGKDTYLFSLDSFELGSSGRMSSVGNSFQGGHGGRFELVSDGAVEIDGEVNVNGGDSTELIGGAGGAVSIFSRNSIILSGNIASNGGTADFVSGRGGDVSLESALPIFFRNSLGGGTISANGGDQGSFFGGNGGRITLMSDSGTVADANTLLSTRGGNASPSLELGEPTKAKGGNGGEISVIGIAASSLPDIFCQGGIGGPVADEIGPTGRGGDGGLVKLHSSRQMTANNILCQGGQGGSTEFAGLSSTSGMGGNGGKCLVGGRLTLNEIDISGGAAGDNSFGGTQGSKGEDGLYLGYPLSLQVSPGHHTFDTTTGEYDGERLASWYSGQGTLALDTLTIQEGATLQIQGTPLFQVKATSDLTIDGVLDASGEGRDNDDPGSPPQSVDLGTEGRIFLGDSGSILTVAGTETGQRGGYIYLTASSDIQASGLLKTNGANNYYFAGQGGDGGEVVITSKTAGLLGLLKVECLGGTGEIYGGVGITGSRGGNGGDVTIQGMAALAADSINCAGGNGGNGSQFYVDPNNPIGSGGTGGDGGDVTASVPLANTLLNLSGGAGGYYSFGVYQSPNGTPGTYTTLGLLSGDFPDLNISAGSRTLNVDTGLLDNRTLPNWDSSDGVLTFESIEISQGATLQLVGSRRIQIRSQSSILISGTLSGSNTGYYGGDGTPVVLTPANSLSVSSTGVIESNGAQQVIQGSAGNGGEVTLLKVDTMDGMVSSKGGSFFPQLGVQYPVDGGDGGDVSITLLPGGSLNGTVQVDGGIGGDGGGDGTLGTVTILP